jgi:hypothetical protein
MKKENINIPENLIDFKESTENHNINDLFGY